MSHNENGELLYFRLCKRDPETVMWFTDYLPEGKYATVTEEEKALSKHSKLTNLVGENDIGDLDFSIKQKPNATLRHHLWVITTKQNHWLA